MTTRRTTVLSLGVSSLGVSLLGSALLSVVDACRDIRATARAG